MELNFTKHMEKKYEDGELRTRDEYEIGHYKVAWVKCFYAEDGSENYENIQVFTADEYMPEIDYHDNFWSKEKPEFKIQTCAYGSKGVDEIEKIISGYQEAVEVVKKLTERFIEVR